MTRVSENSGSHALNYTLGKSKAKLEDLQLKGTNLKNIQKPSDDPVASTEILILKSRKANSDQFARNALMAKSQLEVTENALNDLSEVMLRAKELAIQQSSEVFNQDARRAVSEEAKQLLNQSLAIANKRLGSRYIFGGTKTLTAPFDSAGNYKGDGGKIYVEINKDNFMPVNINGLELTGRTNINSFDAKSQLLEQSKKTNIPIENAELKRDLASKSPSMATSTTSESSENSSKNPEHAAVAETVSDFFNDLQSFHNALQTDNPQIIQTLLDRFDKHLNLTVQLRAQMGSLSSSLESITSHSERDQVQQQAHLSKLEDADVLELFTNIQKNQTTLEATYKSGANMLNKNLLSYLGV